MGEIKTYMVVSNDEYEHIVKADLKGAKSAGEFLGITASAVRQHICRNRWGKKYKYKVIIDTSVSNDPEENRKAYAKRYRMTHDSREYHRKYYQRKKEEKICASLRAELF